MKKIVIILLVLLMLASCFAFASCSGCTNPEGHTFMTHGGPGGVMKCIHCGKVKNSSGSSSNSGGDFWYKVGQGAMIVGFMIAVTAIASLAYWLGCMFGWGWLVWVGHGIMTLMAIGMFIAFHWIWGVVFLVVFSGAYLGLICPLITEKTLGYNGIIH